MADPTPLYPHGGAGQSGAGGSGGGTVDVTMKEYVDAQDAKTRAQNDARFAEVLAGLNKIDANLNAHGAVVLQRFSTIEGELKTTKEAAEQAELNSSEAKSAASNTKWNILATAVGVVAVLLAAWAIWVQGMELVAGLFQ